MSDLILRGLDITNFRSIRGHIHAPLDAKVVLVHGENGAGKTSLLSAIELVLTGGVQSLQRADPAYVKQLLYRSAKQGRVALECASGAAAEIYSADLTRDSARSISAFSAPLAGFFRERTFLPQSLLGQLLQIYQDSGNDADSPLARFVGKLLGLDRLDILEAGLKPFGDIRNVRKHVDGWLAAENERLRLDRLLTDQRKLRTSITETLNATFDKLRGVTVDLELEVDLSEAALDDVARALDALTDETASALLADQQRRLGAIRREIATAQSGVGDDGPGTDVDGRDAALRYEQWQADHGDRLAALRERIASLLPNISLPSDPEEFAAAAVSRLTSEQALLTNQLTQARADVARHAAARAELAIAMQQRDTIDAEVALLPSSAGSLGSALAELTAFLADDICPVCDRNYRDLDAGALADHVHAKVRRLSASAERLLTLGRTRSEAQVAVERLEGEIEALTARVKGSEMIAELDRSAGAAASTLLELDAFTGVLREGAQLRSADVAARRMVSDAESRHVSLAIVRDTLSTFAIAIGAPTLSDGERFEDAAARLETHLAARAVRLESRLAARRRGLDLIAGLRTELARRQEMDVRLATDEAALEKSTKALQAAQTVRDQANAIRTAVEGVRSGIIRREFNTRLNALWRDLFVRLAPGEPFVPAFRIPEGETQRLQPKLITEHLDGGDAGGTPGAMLSAGNLNTAALTLFIALHLSVPRELPWLILDDPVQSMDDVHIAHFAALLRTLSKEHDRQIVIAVHERQLFEYLRLELSPAFPEDSLLTLELSRGARRDTLCTSRRYTFKEETALLSAA